MASNIFVWNKCVTKLYRIKYKNTIVEFDINSYSLYMSINFLFFKIWIKIMWINFIPVLSAQDNIKRRKDFGICVKHNNIDIFIIIN